jgi:hypothetical protein
MKSSNVYRTFTSDDVDTGNRGSLRDLRFPELELPRPPFASKSERDRWRYSTLEGQFKRSIWNLARSARRRLRRGVRPFAWDTREGSRTHAMALDGMLLADRTLSDNERAYVRECFEASMAPIVTRHTRRARRRA